MITRVICPDGSPPCSRASDHWTLSIWFRRVQRMIFRDPRLDVFDRHSPDEVFRAPVCMHEQHDSVPLSALDAGAPSSDSWQTDLCDLFAVNGVPLDKRREFLERITVLASRTSELCKGRGWFTVEANLDHVITDVVPDAISMLPNHAKEGSGDVADPEALHTCPICLDYMTSDCKLVETRCKHIFHIRCIVRWFKTSCTCPICRCALLEEDNIYMIIRDPLISRTSP
ncbi:hypothetical protein CDL15_Pgr020816 [Punica granatum]|uniref:RING-type domain-containing protein n=1 Tax=Punica granatum TaxID=22663 RepID=A0A218XX48_PUNGR|nr:hypothetical protein CDL15_Pgr020816 [Punica granatum]